MLVSIVASAHESPKHQIIHLNDQLQSSASVDEKFRIQALLKRADLQRREQQWEAALTDYDRVIDIDPDNASARVGKANLYLDQKNHKAAIEWSDLVLGQQPEHIQAGLIKARSLAAQGEHLASLKWYEHSIANLKKPTPEHYLEYAEVVKATRGPAADQKAIQILDAGAELLNHPVSLHSASLELETARQDYEAALNRTTFVLNRHSNLLPWLFYQGELLINLKREKEAGQTLSALVSKLGSLSSHRRNSPAMKSLRQSTMQLIAQLNK